MADRLIVGTSGARVYVGRDHVLKYSTDYDVRDRIVAQGEFMRTCESGLFPPVYIIFEYGYTMMRLDPIEWTEDLAYGVLKEVVPTLRKHLWGTNGGLVSFSGRLLGEGPHKQYVNGLLQMHGLYNIAHYFYRMWSELGTYMLTMGTTHGDPTFDNMMRSRGGGITFTDPIPATAKMPNFIASDLGKLLQSVYGYEQYRFGTVPQLDVAKAETLLMTGVSREDERAAYYFHRVHILRLLKYVYGDTREHFKKFLEEICTQEGT